MQLVQLTMNLAPSGQVRQETFEGKTYLVVPVVMLTEGVHDGSQGPLFYPQHELSKFPASWNMKPLVVYHPKEGTACSPDVIAKQGVGMLMNTTWLGKLRSEAWIDEAKCNAVDYRVLAAIRNGNVMEVSTGLFTENDTVSGVWNGEQYVAVARNYRPDHLAILPDKIGACSVAKGAGLLRNAGEGETPLVAPTTHDSERQSVDDGKPLLAPTINYGEQKPASNDTEPLLPPQWE